LLHQLPLSLDSRARAHLPGALWGWGLLWDGRGPQAHWWPRPRPLHLALA
jgi:hypothetical protein